MASLKAYSSQRSTESSPVATISLDEALKKLEQKHQATFLYRLDVVDGKTVKHRAKAKKTNQSD